MTCSEVRAEELALELDPNVQVKEEARRLSEQSNLSDQAQSYQPYPSNNDDVVSYVKENIFYNFTTKKDVKSLTFNMLLMIV